MTNLVMRLAVIGMSASLVACASTGNHATLSGLRHVKIEIKEEKIEGGIERAMQGYERYLAQSKDSALSAEATRRLADLKIEKEYGIVSTSPDNQRQESTDRSVRAGMAAPERFEPARSKSPDRTVIAAAGRNDESERDFENRATASGKIKSAARAEAPIAITEDLEKAGAREAILLYNKLLAKYPQYDRKDQVLYHMSRAYEELGEVDEAMKVMNRFVKEHPGSRYYDEIQFRRGEYFFTRKKMLDAEDAYKPIVAMGERSPFYELALYKLGWSFYKQDLYDEALDKFVGLLDHKTKTGFDFEKSRDDLEKKRVEDTYRVISLSFSGSGGSTAVTDYFAKRGKRPYEVDIYRNLAEFYLDKRRYHDAALTYKAFVERDPLHKMAPHFDMQVIDTYRKGVFPKLVIDSTKDFARRYGLKSAYWRHYDPKAQPEVVGYLKQNLKELANHYHALYRDKQYAKDKDANFREALTWYRESLDSFPRDPEAPAMNYQLADLMLENKAFGDAAAEYEKTAYNYSTHDKASAAGYAAVFALREALKAATPTTRDGVKREVVRSSLRFVDSFTRHEKAALVLGAAVDDLYEMKEHEKALATARRLIEKYPQSEQEIRRAAWLVVAHASLDLTRYEDAEAAYLTTLSLTAANDKARAVVNDNLAAAIYKQGELASKREDHKTAAHHYLRIAQAAPTSTIRPVAEYDGATALMQLREWNQTVEVLQRFRTAFGGHHLQPEVTKKLAFAHRESGQLALAASEYERIETETKDEEQRRGALLLAADLHEQTGQSDRALRVHRRYLDYFPRPLEQALEARYKIAQLHKAANDKKNYEAELRRIVDANARGGGERTDRTRHLAALSALGLTEPLYERFTEIKLVKPFEKNLARKKASMKEATDAFAKLADYGAGEVTAAATFYIAEMYHDFGRALTESERPTNLKPMELEQYEIALEEQVYPFEEKAIAVHEKNVELLGRRIYNAWIDRSIAKLAKLLPARYAKFEESVGFINSNGTFRREAAAPVRLTSAEP